ncbi:MAG: PEP-CTERM sorting domain-containing protein [Pseudomonadota bacterium]|nr:PEP-CTERM sorting domain-containing protein [Pseudomonadota bacterium]
MKKTAFALLLGSAASIASATPVTPVGYDMPNGNGQAAGGQYNYWDKEYTGSGTTSLDNAALSGGTGNLTDGVVSTLNWYSTENVAGTGPYVGWRRTTLPNFQIQFSFGGPVNVDMISIHADDSGGAGGVALPSRVSFDWGTGNVSLAVVDPDLGTAPSWLVFDNLGITSALSINVAFAYGNEWVFVDEVSFDGSSVGVPEPASWALAVLGLAVIPVMPRLRRRSKER